MPTHVCALLLAQPKRKFAMSNRLLSKGLLLAPLVLWAGLAAAQAPTDGERHYDARTAQPRALSLDSSRAQSTQSLSADVQELTSLEVDEITGAVRSLSSERGFLSMPASGQ